MEISGIQFWKNVCVASDDSGSSHWKKTKTRTAARRKPIGQRRDVDIRAGGVAPAGATGSGSVFGAVVVISHLLRGSLAQQALRLEHHEQDEDGEDDGLVPLLAEAEAVVEGLDQADQEAADDGAVEVADAAEHGRRERDEAELEAGVVAGVAARLEPEETGGAGERAAEAEGEGDGPVDVDAHEPRGVLVLRGRAHRLALPGALDDVRHEQQERDGDADDDDRRPPDLDAADGEAAGAQDRRPVPLARAVEADAAPLVGEAEADGGDQRRELRCPS